MANIKTMKNLNSIFFLFGADLSKYVYFSDKHVILLGLVLFLYIIKHLSTLLIVTVKVQWKYMQIVMDINHGFKIIH